MTALPQIPYGAYWSTPFARWQGSFAHLHSLRFAAHTLAIELAARQIDPKAIDFATLGMTRPEKNAFYGVPWLMGLAGAPGVGGPTVAQACASSVRALRTVCQEIADGSAHCALAIACDRTSNGPHIYYPDPHAPGGTGQSEDFIMENMARDPLGDHSMAQTAENCARKFDISTAMQHEVVLRREAQYRDALADDHAFQKRYMRLPFPIPDARLRKTMAQADGDSGVRFSTAEGLAALKPVIEGGTVTFGGQTHPADGNAAIVVTSADRAAQLASDKAIKIEVLGFGQARAALAFMPLAPVPAARQALDAAGIAAKDLAAVKTHNPFAVNDLVLARELGLDVMHMNNYGCSLVYGHPNAPTGLRGCIELIEELVIRGGGCGLFAGCAAGDTAMAVVLRVGDRSV
ncbi:MAG: thiolase family protein [Steroidobacteraceae bacterium]